MDLLADVPLAFVEQAGITNGPSCNTAWAPGVGFTRTGLDLALTDRAGTAQRWGLRLDFAGARPAEP
ncbi:MAG: hypothetical protein ACRDHB_00895 [Actinomycetota bacterium]